MNPDMPWNEEIRTTWARMERLAASPRTVALMLALAAELDVRAVLPTVRVPALVLHHTDGVIIPPAKGKYIAEHIPDAKYVEVPGRNRYHSVEPWRASFREIAEFLTGHQAEVADDRVLATVLFTDIVDSTRRAAEISDRDWRALLDAHDAIVRLQLNRFRGHEVNTSGDGFLAMFDGPQRAIRCAMSIRDAVHALGIEVRAGLHTGECEVRGDDIGGIAVHIGARVSALAGPNDVLVSSTLRDLVIGSGLELRRPRHARAQGRARRVASLRGRVSASDIVGDSRDTQIEQRAWPLVRRRQSGHWILSCFAKLWRAHINWMFFAMSEEPPREYGMMWSKCRLSLLPHSTHLPWSRFHTASFTSVGISRFCSRRGSRESMTGVASGSTSSRNLNKSSVRLFPPAIDKPECAIERPDASTHLSYTRTHSAGVPSSRCCEAAWRK